MKINSQDAKINFLNFQKSILQNLPFLDPLLPEINSVEMPGHENLYPEDKLQHEKSAFTEIFTKIFTHFFQSKR